ncbi:MAG: energy-coupling factor ABC transporter permease, partial [Acidimicrobiia bacterium]|nr:energy-coupling factor ABC transporter permease [Acidimicrobiia bacterium]
LKDRQIPLAGLVAAFVFALQMLNFPVAAGTSGHLLGGALAAVLLGPWMGVVVVSVVVIVQALLFADGGVSALGLNITNMGLLTALVGWGAFRLLMTLLPKRTAFVVGASIGAAWLSVVVSSLGFVAAYALGGSGQAPVGTVLGAMTGVHSLIGIGEGLITGAIVAAVLGVRPDLVYGAQKYELAASRRLMPGRMAIGGFVAAGLAVSLALVIFVAPLANSNPDGLERVARDQGFIATAEDSATAESPLADYSVTGVENDRTGTVVAGLIGTILVFLVGAGILMLVGRKRPQPKSEAGP